MSDSVNSNNLLLNALQRKDVPRPPLWMMRQAGRYLPEYRSVREKADFFSMVRTPELACEVTLQPIRRYGLDAAIIFSDILVIPQALGLEVVMEERVGPRLPQPIRQVSDLKKLRTPEIEQDLGYVFQAIQLVCSELAGAVPLIGFAGAPWTILAYMVEGGGSKAFAAAKQFIFSQPQAAHDLLQRITDCTISYLLGQVAAGAAVLQLFDSWAGLLGPDDFEAFSLPYITQIVERVSEKAPVIVFAKDAHYALEGLARTGAAALGLDWTMDPLIARRRVPEICLQGNLDPTILFGEKNEIISRTERMLARFGKHAYIANLGHGLLPGIDPDKVAVFVETVRNYSWR